jgi:UDP-N-acetylmuramoyl-tripeptide--D-alanyl-D-alanine ligase
MKPKFLTLTQIATWVEGRLIGADTTIDSVSTDTRTLTSGALFVALQGPKFDGHDYASQAATKQANALLVNRQLPISLPQIVVTDTLQALQTLATAWRNTLTAHVVAVTGSNGKTTTKELITQILSQAGSTQATKGNLNNAIGVPLTLLTARDQAYLVIEMGANHPGEIAILSAITRPDVAIITNAGRAHLEGFGSTAGVANAKGEIFSGVNANGICILNADDNWFPLWKELADTRSIITFGRKKTANVTLDMIEMPLQLTSNGFYSQVRLSTPRGTLVLDLALAGDHNLMNVLAAVAVAEALNIDHKAIKAGIANVKPVPGRLCPKITITGTKLIDDSYNANPDSVRAALTVLGSIPAQRRWLALGDLGELGPEAANLHKNIGEEAHEAGIDYLWATGTLSLHAVTAFGANGRHFIDKNAMIAELVNELQPNDLILVKGSHSAAMDQVVSALIK